MPDTSRAIIDLSHPLISGQVPTCIGHPCFSASLNFSLAKGDFANVHALTIGTHTGTHLDAPYHFFENGATVDCLDLTLLAAAPAVVADVRHRSAHERIIWEDLMPAAEEVTRRGARVLLLCTGWSRNWTKANYSDHPYLDAEAVKRVLGLGVRVIGLDTLSPDEVTPEREGADVHRAVLGNGGIIVENLTRLDALVDSGWKCITVSLLPLNLGGCDGSPLRAVAWDGTE
ncbi:putative cyclase [Dichomitus squalens]|uniref:Putative cyclase n=1 Tax=Dichomitus squalens TaxID=114155 RepID=A0A4Q9M7N1_9APHY|nr:putative cyclase [Dichomitus squalens]